ncbi:thioredoxin reductase [Rhodoligotrophos appendicifer]|uniref:FAD-dependent oxidoreductase n=1 Tax=Rhodoligotrophos appendicifer TaxID=987056 RepID=UPI0014788CDC|nr:FAD-dependent oxidoreductase [Rhodoligotrophos appendicifer]
MRDPAVLIVGAGPAGLAAAAGLKRRGIHDILLIDRDDEPGGLPRFCHHPGFGLGYSWLPRSGPGFAAKLLKDAEDVEILCGTTMISLAEGPIVTISGPLCGHRELHPRAVILATGIREANRGNRLVPGARPESGILTTGLLQQMAARKVPFPPKMRSLLVVGTEHVSFSAIWTARNAGLKVVAMVDDHAKVQSLAAAAWMARIAKIDLHLETRIASIEADANKVSGVVIDGASGRRKLSCDGIVFTAGWIPETAALVQGPVKLSVESRGIVVDSSMRTNVPGVFAAGNALGSVKSSGTCAKQGARTAASLALSLKQP